MDSAPELRLTAPSPLTPSYVAPVAGSYIGAPAGFCAEEPAGGDAGELRAARPSAGALGDRRAAPAPGRRRRTRSGCRRSGAGSQPLSGPVAVSRRGVKRGRVGDRRRRAAAVGAARSTAAASADGICAPQACQSERDSAHGRTAPYGHGRRCRRRPSRRCPRRAAPAPYARRRRPPARTYARRPEHRLGRLASAPSTISQAGTRTPSTIWYCAVADEHLAVERGDGQVEAVRAGTRRTPGRRCRNAA